MSTDCIVDPNKSKVWEFCYAPLRTSAERIERAIAAHASDDYRWRGVHPLNEHTGVASVVQAFWHPLRESLPDLERRDDIFLAGEYDGSDWVCATGYLFGTFSRDWLGIPATGRCAWLRFGEFHRIDDGGRVAETYCFLDLPSLMRQAGTPVLPHGLGAEILPPAPASQDGLLFAQYDKAESHKTLELVEAMLFGGLMRFDQSDVESMGMERYWHPNMMWYGPSGIGTTRGLRGFQAQHQQPFLYAFPDRRVGENDPLIAEGHYAGIFGWPNMVATHTGGGWLGLGATGKQVNFRVMDVWRREGERLRENWVFIDLPHLLLQMGVDAFERLAQYRRHL